MSTCVGSKGFNLWESATATKRGLIRLAHPEPYQACLAFSADGRVAASAGDRNTHAAGSMEEGVIYLIDTTTGCELGRCAGHVGRVESLVFSPYCYVLSSGGPGTSI